MNHHSIDLAAIRAQFPILTQKIRGKDLVFLDSAASAQKPRAVIDAMVRVMEHSYANVHRGLHTLANETTDAYEAAVQSSIDLAKEVAALIDELPHVELIREPGLSIVLWRRPGWTKVDYLRLQDELLAQQVAFATPTVWEGEVVGRFALLHPSTTLDMVEAVLEAAR